MNLNWKDGLGREFGVGAKVAYTRNVRGNGIVYLVGIVQGSGGRVGPNFHEMEGESIQVRLTDKSVAYLRHVLCEQGGRVNLEAATHVQQTVWAIAAKSVIVVPDHVDVEV